MKAILRGNLSRTVTANRAIVGEDNLYYSLQECLRAAQISDGLKTLCTPKTRP